MRQHRSPRAEHDNLEAFRFYRLETYRGMSRRGPN